MIKEVTLIEVRIMFHISGHVCHFMLQLIETLFVHYFDCNNVNVINKFLRFTGLIYQELDPRGISDLSGQSWKGS